ncbi:hypothetical protein J7J59_00940 [Candidatus Aerophobetes bacterium]|nr:hypothetical protein [Candidatus Aerophobetes bacterium]
MFHLAIKQWAITIGLVWTLFMISVPLPIIAAQENTDSEWWENIELSQEAIQVLSAWKDYLRLWKAVEGAKESEKDNLRLKLKAAAEKSVKLENKWDKKMKNAISFAYSKYKENHSKLMNRLADYEFEKKYLKTDGPVITKLESMYINIADLWRQEESALTTTYELVTYPEGGKTLPDNFVDYFYSWEEKVKKLREAELYILQTLNQAIIDVLAGKRARYFTEENLEAEKNIITEDAIQFLNSYPSNGAKFSPEKTKSFRADVAYTVTSEDKGIIKVRAVAIMEGGIKEAIGEKNIPITKGEKKKTKVELPLNIPEKAEKVLFTAKLILEKGGDIGVYDEISAIPWIPANVELIVPGGPIIANGRGAYSFKVKVMQRGKPVEGAKIEIWPQASSYPFMTNAKLVGSSGVLHLTTDASGMAQFYYKPPKILPEKLPRFPGKKTFTYPLFVKAPGLAKSKVWEISLYPPHPRIKSLRVSELSAGDWQKAESIVEVEDLDSTFFTYTILFNGNIGWKGGHDNFKKLVADGEKLFAFRLKPIRFGMDLQDLPSLYEKLWETNEQFIINEIFSLGAFRLEKAEVFKNLVDKLKKTKLILDVKEPAKDLKGTAELWGKTAEEVGKGSLSMKNASDAMGVYIKGYNTTVGVVDYVDSWSDLLKNTAPSYDPYSTALKLIYENAKTFYDVFEAHRKVAEAYEDVVFFPILVKVKDADGYSDIKIKKVAVRFWKR